ncbi:MAG TPA: D-glycero-beta-D-manno-heptose 1-phosphate adenylyltransferase [Phycisphaerae bacterium]|nr:D-glycero-beta-D-manno-heptose 1-phosphate adenylyltransferase [Phycisphaerae bacterium]
MIDGLTSLVRSFAGRRVLLVGDLILDRYIYGDAERISPEAPVPVLRAMERFDRVGGSANVAACLRALGVEVVCCGVTGDDEAARELDSLLSELGVDRTGVVRSGSRPTTTKTRLVGLAQHRHRQQLLRLDDESTAPLEAAEAERLAERAWHAVADVDAVCIEDYDKGVVSVGLVASLRAEAKRQAKPILVDPARLTDYSRYRGATILTPNRGELLLATGRPPQGNGTPEEIARRAAGLLKSVGAEAVVVTLDREGAVLVRGTDNWTHVPTRPRSVYDNTGAGDAVLAMLAAAVAADGELLDAVRLANIAGGLEVEKFGCVPITTDEVLAELRLEGNRQAGKLRGADELVAELALRRDRGETVVFTNGCFDILHAGHVDLLARCRQEGSLLVVGLNSDASVRSLSKGAGRPINSQDARGAVLGALECVDYVVLFDEPTPEQLIRRIRPDVLVKGQDWADKGVVGGEFVEREGGKVVLLPLVEGHSTTDIIERIKRAEG